MPPNAAQVSLFAPPAPGALVLRPYQVDAVVGVETEWDFGARGVLLVSPTGSGKTTTAEEIIRRELARGGRVIFVAHRKELIDQASRRLDGGRIEHGVIMADHPRRLPWLPVQVASVQTLSMRASRGKRPDAPTLWVIDEAHRALAPSYRTTMDGAPQARVLGLTATPWRAGNRGLGTDVFSALVVATTPAALRDDGFLTPVAGFAFDRPDLSGVRTTAGDYDEKQLGALMGKTELVGNVAARYVSHLAGKRAVVFAVHVAHSQQLAREFKACGVRAEHLDGTTPKPEREAILGRLSTGDTEVLCNVGVLTEGWDCPSVEACILARPTQSQSLYLQMVGRVLRPYCYDCGRDADWRLAACHRCGSPRVKREARLHDHAGCVVAHGLPFAERDYSLDFQPPKKRKKKDDEEEPATIRTCAAVLADGSACMALYDPAEHDACPACGYRPEPRKVVQVEGVARSLEDAAAAAPAFDPERKAAFFRLAAICRNKGARPHVASRMYHEQFSEYPPMQWQRSAWWLAKRSS